MNPTLRYSLTYGGLAGAVLGLFIALVAVLHERVAWVSTYAFGYAVMLLAMSSIFVGVKRYRDVEGGGVIRFGRAFGLGLLIALIAGVAYVVFWEVHLAMTHYRFFDDYVAKVVRDAQSSGKSAVEVAKMSAEMESMRTMYANPLFRMPMTFAEVAPVGLLVALISAALLRNPKLLPAHGGSVA